MSNYNTGNPVPSIDPRDLDDNAAVFDELLQQSVPSVPDRLGVARKTWWQMEQDALALISPNISALAGLTGAADRLAYFTGVGAMALTPLTAVARALLDDTTVAAQRATLGLVLTTTATDTTAGSVLKVGDFGVGGSILPTSADADAIRAGGSYQLSSAVATAAGLPLSVGYTLLHIGGSSGTSGHTQFASPMTSVAGNRNKVFHRQLFSSAWSAWEEFAYGGANSSITSLTGLTTPLSTAQGGTGVTTGTGTGANVQAVSPALTGTPTTPTPAVGTNTTQIATAAMVQAEIANKRAWTSFTPTISVLTGVYTSASATGTYMVAFGICYVRMQLTVTTKGTGANPSLTLPFAALSGHVNDLMLAREVQITGTGGNARVNSGLTGVSISSYNAVDLITADGCVVVVTGSYPIA